VLGWSRAFLVEKSKSNDEIGFLPSTVCLPACPPVFSSSNLIKPTQPAFADGRRPRGTKARPSRHRRRPAAFQACRRRVLCRSGAGRGFSPKGSESTRRFAAVWPGCLYAALHNLTGSRAKPGGDTKPHRLEQQCSGERLAWISGVSEGGPFPAWCLQRRLYSCRSRALAFWRENQASGGEGGGAALLCFPFHPRARSRRHRPGI